MTAEYTLYELVTQDPAVAGEQEQVSPFVWKTRADLAILGVPYKTCGMTFPQIRSTLASESGNKDVTVPTLKTAEGEYITDSSKIAIWLNERHGTADRNLFPNAAAQSFGRFVNLWSDTVLAPALRHVFRPLFHCMQDDASQEYFTRVKYSGDADGLASDLKRLQDPNQVEGLCKDVRAALGLWEKYLSEAGPFVLGDKPSHADSAVWGWYCSSLVNSKAENLIWSNPSLPATARWVKAMKEATVVPKYNLDLLK